jgi:phosphoglycerate dehydrogenase-like enzyme
LITHLDGVLLKRKAMKVKPPILVLAWLPDGMLPRLEAEFSDFEWIDARDPAALDRHIGRGVIAYGLPPVSRLGEAGNLSWIQLISAGVPQDLCPVARDAGVTVTNLAGLYGPTIAEHAFALMGTLTRNLHIAFRNQHARRWDRDVALTMGDLHGKTLAIVGLGNIGRAIARLGKAYGMRVLGCRRRDLAAPIVDRLYPLTELHAMLAEADVVAVAAPLTARTEGMLGPAEFAAMKRGVIYVNISRGGVAQEKALLGGLQSGHVAAAGLDVFATEPLAPDHPLWSLPQVVISPHYSGETVNLSAMPAQRFARNLRRWPEMQTMEGMVDLEHGY